ncbi:MAG: VOC family protein, partial [Dehalococcoidia bacterium]|nr:VOC family protein [Dehalococcoidia bacterium]
PESASAQFLAEHGEGIHHIGFEVDDTDAELARCAEMGAELITSKGRPALDYIIGFLRPAPGSGVTIEFLQKVK